MPFRFLAGQWAIGRVGACAGMGVHDQHWAWLLLQVRQAGQQHCVFKNVGMVPGVERVAVGEHAHTLQGWQCSNESACTK